MFMLALCLAARLAPLAAAENPGDRYRAPASWKTCGSAALGFKMNCGSGWAAKEFHRKTLDAIVFAVSRGAKTAAMIKFSYERGVPFDLATGPAGLKEYYGERFTSASTRLAGRQALRVEGTSENFPVSRVRDFLVSEPGGKSFYRLSFSVAPPDRWPEFEPTFEKALATFRFIQTKR